MNNPITRWFKETARVWSRELRLIFTDAGMLLFFFALPLAYPLVYTLIYNPEVVTDIPVTVVDNSRTSASRELTRSIDATSAIKIVGYATSLSEARRWQAEKRCYGILVIPEDYDREIGRGEQTHVDFYSDMSLLLRFRTFLSALTDVQLATGAKIRTQKMEAAGLPASEAPISSEAFFLGDSEQGFASFIIPGIVVLIIQQSMILGIAMLVGTSRERRRRNGGIDPLEIQATPSATMAGKLLAYLVPYLPMAIYALHYVPLIFSLPHSGSMTQYLPFFLPMLIASAGFGLVISQIFIKEREMSLMVVVFTSVGFLFLSGLTWPRYAMHPLWQWIGNCIPAVWGVEGFIRINSNGATLAQNSHPYLMLWLLSAIYWSIYWVMLRHKRKKLF
ncbi:MAG: ABC transporter permease [Muribaculaceae bacterium]|nr:ABC transporter permease [Muribaculaceae bacterium]MDE5971748.1 ABC transporter permease [Muribaculaceae bacterium]MDE6462372.1 ABC transporter permease [Muribaculaceae bacterium]